MEDAGVQINTDKACGHYAGDISNYRCDLCAAKICK